MRDPKGKLVCVTAYKRGAVESARNSGDGSRSNVRCGASTDVVGNGVASHRAAVDAEHPFFSVTCRSEGAETETPLAERIAIGLFITAEPGRDAFDPSHVVLMERRPISSGRQVRFVTDRKPTHAGVDPYNFYVDRNSADNVMAVK